MDDLSSELYLAIGGDTVLASPVEATLADPADVTPDESSIALTITRLQHATILPVDQVRHAWTGLRSFAPDEAPVVGRDYQTEGFIWLAGQGGAGIMTSPALSRIAAASVLERDFPPDLAALGLSAAELSPVRLRPASKRGRPSLVPTTPARPA